MTREKFLNLIAAYGRSPDNWPDEVRTSAVAYMTANQSTLQEVLSDAARIDAALDRVDVAPPSELLKPRILRSLPAQIDPPPARQSGFGFKSVAVMVLFAFGLGFGGAQFVSLPVQTDEPTILAVNETVEDSPWLEAANDLGFSDVYYWVEGEETVTTPGSGI